jgi:hypothetical protein
MEDDLTELARICLEHARTSQVPKLSAQLLRMAKDYQRRAALLHDDIRPHVRRGRVEQRRRGRSALAPQLVKHGLA